MVGPRQVYPTVVIHIYKNRGQAVVSAWIRNAGFDANIRESAIAIVVEQMVGLSRQTSWSAHHRNPSKLAKIGGNDALSRDRRIVHVELHINHPKQTQQ